MDADNPPLYGRLQTAVSEMLTSTEWTLTETTDGYRVTVSGRCITITPHESPSGRSNWVLTLLVDGETVGKFGPYATTEAAVEQVCTILESKAVYTVCCDGSPD